MEDWARQHDIVLWALRTPTRSSRSSTGTCWRSAHAYLRRQEVCHVATVASLISAGMGMGFMPTFLADSTDRDTVSQIALPQGAPAVDFYCTSDASIRPPRPSTYSPGAGVPRRRRVASDQQRFTIGMQAPLIWSGQRRRPGTGSAPPRPAIPSGRNRLRAWPAGLPAC